MRYIGKSNRQNAVEKAKFNIGILRTRKKDSLKTGRGYGNLDDKIILEEEIKIYDVIIGVLEDKIEQLKDGGKNE